MTFEVVNLPDVADLVPGYPFDAEMFNDAGNGVPVIRIRDVVRGFSETCYSGEYPAESVVSNGDFLVGMDGEFNISAWNGGTAVLNQRVCKIVPRKSVVEPSYLLRILPRELKRIEDRTPFVTVKHLSMRELKAIKLALPPILEQRRIADILDKADAVRKKRSEALVLAGEFLRSVFLDMFGDPVTNHNRWPVYALEELCSRITVGYVGPMASEYVSNGVPLLRSLNIKRGKISVDNLVFVPPEFHKRLVKSELRAGDVVSVRTGKPGVTAVIPESLGVANCADLIVITPQPSISSHYLAEVLNMRLGDKDVIQGTVGAIQEHFNIGRARELLIPTPPIALQKRFDSLISHHRQMLARMELHGNVASNMFSSISEQAFRAQL
jgi:type I restriction enzyme S subunit